MTRQEQAQQYKMERKFVTANSPRQMGIIDATNDLGYHCPFPEDSAEEGQYLAGFNSVLFAIADPETEAYLGRMAEEPGYSEYAHPLPW